MAGSVNKVILIGNVGKDIEVRSTQDGKSIGNLSVATSESWKEKSSGEKREKTEWHKVSIFNDGLVKALAPYLVKGTKVYVEGQLTTRKWQDKDGQDRYTTEVVVQAFNGTIHLLGGGGKRGSDEGDVPADADYDPQPTKSSGGLNSRGADEELPFAFLIACVGGAVAALLQGGGLA